MEDRVDQQHRERYSFQDQMGQRDTYMPQGPASGSQQQQCYPNQTAGMQKQQNAAQGIKKHNLLHYENQDTTQLNQRHNQKMSYQQELLQQIEQRKRQKELEIQRKREEDKLEEQRIKREQERLLQREQEEENLKKQKLRSNEERKQAVIDYQNGMKAQQEEEQRQKNAARHHKAAPDIYEQPQQPSLFQEPGLKPNLEPEVKLDISRQYVMDQRQQDAPSSHNPQLGLTIIKNEISNQMQRHLDQFQRPGGKYSREIDENMQNQFDQLKSEMQRQHGELLKNINQIKEETDRVLKQKNLAEGQLGMVEKKLALQNQRLDLGLGREQDRDQHLNAVFRQPNHDDLSDFFKHYGVRDIDDNPIPQSQGQRQQDQRGEMNFYSKNGGQLPTNQTLKFETESNFVPLDFANLKEFSGDASMRKLADHKFRENVQSYSKDDQAFMTGLNISQAQLERENRPYTQQNIRESREYETRLQGRGPSIRNAGQQILLRDDDRDPLEDTIDRLIKKYNQGDNELTSNNQDFGLTGQNSVLRPATKSRAQQN